MKIQWKKRRVAFIFLILALLVTTVIVIVAKISPYRCCACLPDRPPLYPLSFTLLENHWAQFIDCYCPPEIGCALSFWIIPVDLIGLIVVLTGILLYTSKKK
jgi:hypothetical protein